LTVIQNNENKEPDEKRLERRRSKVLYELPRGPGSGKKLGIKKEKKPLEDRAAFR